MEIDVFENLERKFKKSKWVKISSMDVKHFERNASISRFRASREVMLEAASTQIFYDVKNIEILNSKKESISYISPSFNLFGFKITGSHVVSSKSAIKLGKGVEEAFMFVDTELSLHNLKEHVNVYCSNDSSFEEIGELFLTIDEFLEPISKDLIREVIKGYISFIDRYLKTYRIVVESPDFLKEYYISNITSIYTNTALRLETITPLITIFEESEKGESVSLISIKNRFPNNEELKMSFGLDYDYYKGDVYIGLFYLYNDPGKGGRGYKISIVDSIYKDKPEVERERVNILYPTRLYV